MNRVPRRPPMAPLPLQGRLAAAPTLRKNSTVMTVVRQRPPISSGHTTVVRVIEKPVCDDIHSDWIMLYKRSPGLFKVLERPWKWLIVVIILMILSGILGSLL